MLKSPGVKIVRVKVVSGMQQDLLLSSRLPVIMSLCMSSAKRCPAPSRARWQYLSNEAGTQSVQGQRAWATGEREVKQLDREEQNPSALLSSLEQRPTKSASTGSACSRHAVTYFVTRNSNCSPMHEFFTAANRAKQGSHSV